MTQTTSNSSNNIAKEQLNGGQALIRSLELEGVEVMFGLPGGATVLTWDGRDGTGFQAAPGLYFARLSTPRGLATQPLIWLR